jgi:hypothetical protein
MREVGGENTDRRVLAHFLQRMMLDDRGSARD